MRWRDGCASGCSARPRDRRSLRGYPAKIHARIARATRTHSRRARHVSRMGFGSVEISSVIGGAASPRCARQRPLPRFERRRQWQSRLDRDWMALRNLQPRGDSRLYLSTTRRGERKIRRHRPPRLASCGPPGPRRYAGPIRQSDQRLHAHASHGSRPRYFGHNLRACQRLRRIGQSRGGKARSSARKSRRRATGAHPRCILITSASLQRTQPHTAIFTICSLEITEAQRYR